MLKIYLISVLPVQPLSFSFSTSAFQFQLSLCSVSALQRVFFSSFSFLVQRLFFSSFSFLVQRLFLSSFSSRVALFSAQKHFFQAKTILFFSPKPFSVQPKTFLFCCFTSLYLSKSSFFFKSEIKFK